VAPLVVFESMYGNTRAIAEAIAEGLGSGAVQAVHEAGTPEEGITLLMVGGPTHMHGLSSSMSGGMAADAAKEDAATNVEPGATQEPGLRRWLRDLPSRPGALAAMFDTRLDRSPHVAGSAAPSPAAFATTATR
jgi:hypothetical protein